MAEETDFEIGHFRKFDGPVTIKRDHVKTEQVAGHVASV